MNDDKRPDVEWVSLELPDEFADSLASPEEQAEFRRLIDERDESLPVLGDPVVMDRIIALARTLPGKTTLTRELVSGICPSCKAGDCVQRVTLHAPTEPDGEEAFTLEHGVAVVDVGRA